MNYWNREYLSIWAPVVVKGQRSGKGQNVDGRPNLAEMKRSSVGGGSAWAEEVQRRSAKEAGWERRPRQKQTNSPREGSSPQRIKVDVRFRLPTPRAHFPCPPDTTLKQLADSQQPVIFSHKLSPFSLSCDSLCSNITPAVSLTCWYWPKWVFYSGPEVFLLPVPVCVSGV